MTITPLSEVLYLAIHHVLAAPAAGAEELDKADRKAGFRSIGYHYVIRRDGTVEAARSENEPGIHTPGFDRRALSIALIGNGDPEDDTPEQRAALATLTAELEGRYPAAVAVSFRELQAARKAA